MISEFKENLLVTNIYSAIVGSIGWSIADISGILSIIMILSVIVLNGVKIYNNFKYSTDSKPKEDESIKNKDKK